MPKTKATAPAGSAVQSPSLYTVLCHLVDTAESCGASPGELSAARAARDELGRLTGAITNAMSGLVAAEWVLSVPEDDPEAAMHAEVLARRQIVEAVRAIDQVQARLCGGRMGYFDPEGEA